MNDIPNHNILLEILHQRKRVAKAEAADLAVKLKVDFDELLAKRFKFTGENLWKKAEKIAAKAAAKAQKTVADRCEKELGIPREFAPYVSSQDWRGHSLVDDRKAELSRSARTVIEVRLKAAGRQIEKHTLAAMQKIIQPGLNAADAQAVIDDLLPLSDLMPPVTYQEAEALRCAASRSRQPWHDSSGRMESRMRASSSETEDVDAESLRDNFLKLLD